MFVERGYTTLEVDVSLPAPKLSTSNELLRRMVAGATFRAKELTVNGILTQRFLQS
jgi:hypothetical protein